MTGPEIEHAIGFLLEHHARVSIEIEKLKDVNKQQAANITNLANTIEATGAKMREGFAETREALDNLIIANEVTRDLAKRAAELAIATSQRLAKLEQD